MRSAAYIIALLGSSVVIGAAVPSPDQAPSLTTATLSDRQADGSRAVIERDITKREPVTVLILTTVGTAAITAVVTEAVTAAAAFIGDVISFDKGREAFTQQTTDAMMNKNPDPSRFVAAACYNKGYSVANPENIDGLNSVEFSSGILHTDYDCMYLAAPNQFYTHGDGGFINLSYTYTDRCSFDEATGDLTCN
ncbi:hypothetical protein BN1723_014754 [Verticillium longisporum]|uniref:DUF7888 domain-containing protein n=1 Tax=Verticillium longisporum TaxID=100787 RepID=A0A0G4MHE4_VERLO|nr:hypothetical protein BN1708_014036 [Verticillium longisporum]CRK33619.1 hypothetical protein BN1723_014754 [Verticillium longisporum]